MAALTDPFVVYPGSPHGALEPEEEWKIRKRIEDDFKPATEELERKLKKKLGGKLKRKLRGFSLSEDSKAIKDYDNALAELRQAASDQYYQLLKLKLQERQSAALGVMAKNSQPRLLAARGEDRYQPSPVPGRGSLSQKSIDEGGM